MIKIYPHENLGHFQNDWLDSRHHFSFGEYFDPARKGFFTLRVVNDDVIKAGSGFGLHPHKDMEIITYVRSGTIMHEDSLGNKGATEAGDVQVMSAGSGIEHAEYADKNEDTTLFQIWIRPRENGIAPRWDQAVFPKDPVSGDLPLLVSGRAAHKDSGALYIHQDASIHGGRLPAGTQITHDLAGHPAYMLVSDGVVDLDGQNLKKGDGAEITDLQKISIAAPQGAEILLISL